LRTAGEIDFQFVGTEKKTPSLLEAGYNFELSPHALRLKASATEVRAMRVRFI
jgi:hypothetical protein